MNVLIPSVLLFAAIAPPCSHCLLHKDVFFTHLGSDISQQTPLLRGCPLHCAQVCLPMPRCPLLWLHFTNCWLSNPALGQPPCTGKTWPPQLRVLHLSTGEPTVYIYLSSCSGFKNRLVSHIHWCSSSLCFHSKIQLCGTMASHFFPTAKEYLAFPLAFELNCSERKEEEKRKDGNITLNTTFKWQQGSKYKY